MLFASLSSYRETVDGISLLIGYPRSHESIRQSVIREEAKLTIKEQEERLERIRNFLEHPRYLQQLLMPI
jgi:hypothetical protein